MAAVPENNAERSRVLLTREAAKQLALHIVEYGVVSFCARCLQEMRDNDLQTSDCLNLIRGGCFQNPEIVAGELRCKVRTGRMCFLVVFRSTERILVVTGWRNR